jgi:hypothetical protein
MKDVCATEAAVVGRSKQGASVKHISSTNVMVPARSRAGSTVEQQARIQFQE